MTEQVLQALAVAPGAQTAASLCDSLRRTGLRAEEFQVIESLRRLQKDGFVLLERGTNRWRLLKLPPDFKPPYIPPIDTSRTKSSHTQGQVQAEKQQPAPLPIIPPSAPAGRWEMFRRLCRYYMDCLLQDDAPQLRVYVENEDDTWVAAREIPWGRLAAGGDFAVSLSRDQAPFHRNRVRRGADECVYLCYPLILVKPKDMSGFIVPLFAQPMLADWRAGVLHLKPDGPISVNGAWLEFRFRQRGEREAFLRAMGFLTETNNDDANEERTAPGPKDFARLAQDAAHYIHDPDRFAQQVDPFALSSIEDWNKAKPGLYNVPVLTLGPRMRYTRSLWRDLRDISQEFSDEELDGTALATLFPHENPPPPDLPTLEPSTAVSALGGQPHAFTPTELVQTRLLQPRQRLAVSNSMAEPVSVVTGPPGTGKSEVVTAMLLNHLLRGQPTLFASKNHQALEAVLPRLNSAVGGGELIIQTSSRELAQRQNYLAKLQSILARPPRPDAAQGVEYRQRFANLFCQQGQALSDISALDQAGKDYEALTAQLEGLRKQLPVTAQSDHAIAGWPSEVGSEQLDKLESRLKTALARPVGILQTLWHWLRRREMEQRRAVALQPVRSLPNPFADRSFPCIEATADSWDDFFKTWKVWSEAYRVDVLVRVCEQRMGLLPKAEDSNRRLTIVQSSIEDLTGEWMRWAGGGLPSYLAPSDREALANLRAGIQTWGGDRFAKEMRKHFPLIMRAFPLWSVSNLSARGALPLLPGLFNLVIVDEACQCDIASVVPLLARSKRAVFAGDPMQLRHVSTLDAVVDQALLEQHTLTVSDVQRFSYRVNSAFDLAFDNSAVPDPARVRLDLHFRSHELIADYCNAEFYSQTLYVVTRTEQLKIPRGMKPGIHWTHVAAKLEPGTTGMWCADEVEIVRNELRRLAVDGYRGTVGVVTPFRQQMIRLKDALEAGGALPADFMERVRFLASTAHGFQGDERDLILFSLCGGPDMTEGSTIFLRESPNLFNVAVSRARAVLHIVGNRDWALGSGISFIEKLARRTMPDFVRQPIDRRDLYQSPWEQVLCEALLKVGLNPTPQYPIAGRFLDLALLGPKKIDIEVDGESFHRTAGGGRKDDDLWRDLQLQSLGWQVCRFWVYELREDLPGCVARVVKAASGCPPDQL